MPTGYTSPVLKGATFHQYLQSCARAFIIQLRDDPYDAPLPRCLPPDTYHADALAEAKANRDRVMALSAAELDAEAETAHVTSLARWEERQQEKKEQLAKYTAMLEQVTAWKPPTPEHEPLKTFMASQLRDSIAYDCYGDPKYDPKPEPMTGEQYLRERLERINHDIGYHGERVQKKDAGHANINVWLEAIHKSMETPT